MIVVHFAKVSALYPRVVISSLAKRLEKSLFCHSYTILGVWPRDCYMPLQRFTIGVCNVMRCYGFPWPQAPLVVLRFPLTSDPSCIMWIQVTSSAFPHTIEQDSQPIASLISKQAVLYRTRGGTCCPGVLLALIKHRFHASTCWVNV